MVAAVPSVAAVVVVRLGPSDTTGRQDTDHDRQGNGGGPHPGRLHGRTPGSADTSSVMRTP